MQVLSFVLLSLQFVLQFPVLLNKFIGSNQHILMILGLDVSTATQSQIWFTRVHLIVLSYAVVMTEVYFVCLKVKTDDKKRVELAKDNAAQFGESNLKRQNNLASLVKRRNSQDI
jgi:hypothetical protein